MIPIHASFSVVKHGPDHSFSSRRAAAHVATLARARAIVDDGDLRRRGRPRGTGHRGQDVEVAMDLTRTEPESAVQHFYRMELMPGLFGDWTLVREWGRVGQPWQIRVDWFDTRRPWARSRRCSGMRARPSRPRERPLILLPQ